MSLIQVNCYSCNSNDYHLYDSENGFNLVKCSKCGLLYVNPRPSQDDISRAMVTGLHKGETAFNFTGRYKKNKPKKYVKILSDFFTNRDELSGKNWLDLGCGFGEFLQALRIFSNGKLTTFGSEPNEAKTQFALSNNLDVCFLDMDLHKPKYDYISLLNVFSHIPDPIKFISDLKKNLKSQGYIFLQTGNSAHLDVKHHHRPYQLPDHLSFANQEILENIFKKLEFEVIKVKIYPQNYLNPLKVAKGFTNVLLRRRKSFRGLIPRGPYQDMYMLCKLN